MEDYISRRIEGLVLTLMSVGDYDESRDQGGVDPNGDQPFESLRIDLTDETPEDNTLSQNEIRLRHMDSSASNNSINDD